MNPLPKYLWAHLRRRGVTYFLDLAKGHLCQEEIEIAIQSGEATFTLARFVANDLEREQTKDLRSRGVGVTPPPWSEATGGVS